MIRKITFIAIFWLGSITIAWSQFSAYNIAEYAMGNIPGEQPNDVNSLYDQLNLQYKYKGFTGSVRLENYYSTDPEREDYAKLTQYTFSYRNEGFNLKAGHIYETVGKGLLYRGYEIKSSIYEDRIYRVKQGFYRDLLGASGSFSNKYFSVKGLRGKSLINELPPTSSENRLDLVSAGEVAGHFFNQKVGMIYLQNENEFEKSNYISSILGGNFLGKFDYYGEYAHRVNRSDNYFSFEDDDAYGAYFSLSYSTNGFGLSFEAKDYHNLFIGSGISDPPTLVKEHSYRLLNRSTHVPYLFDESGIQIELFIVPKEDHLITLNHSRSKNDLGLDNDFKSAEYFAEWSFTSHKVHQVKLFADYSFDDIFSETARYAGGMYYTRTLQKKWSFSVETEFQQLERTQLEKETYQNVYAGFIINRSTKFSAALIWEFTNDNKFADLSGTEEVEPNQHFPGINLLYKPNRKNTILLFAGKRRGGPACSAGVCYEVLDFKGIELRWSLKI